MTRLLVAAACTAVLACCTWRVAAQDSTPEPVGYIIETNPEAEFETEDIAAPPAPTAFIVRNGERVPASEGMEVVAGDAVTTDAGGAIAVAFLDSSAVTLDESTRLVIGDFTYPNKKAPTHISLEIGRAFFDIQPRPEEAHFFVRTSLGEVEVKGTKFELWSTRYGDNGFLTTISVTKGAVGVTPNGANAVEVLDGTQLILDVKNINVAGWGPGTVELKKGNISKERIKMLDKVALCDVHVSVSKSGKVSIKSWNNNPDGTKTYIKLTEIQGKKIQMTTTVKLVVNGKAGKRISTIKETKTGKVTVKTMEFNQYKVGQSLVSGSGIARIYDRATKMYYRGSVRTMADGTVLPDGRVLSDGTVVSDVKAKNGSRLVLTKQRFRNGTVVTTQTTFSAGATQGTQYTEIKRRDGLRDTWFETVTTTQLPNGDFVSVSGPYDNKRFPPLPPGAPEVLSQTATIVIPDTTTPGNDGYKLVPATAPDGTPIPNTFIIVPVEETPVSP